MRQLACRKQMEALVGAFAVLFVILHGAEMFSGNMAYFLAMPGQDITINSHLTSGPSSD